MRYRKRLARGGKLWIWMGYSNQHILSSSLIIALIIFGPGKLPELGRGLGKSIREFKDAIRGINEETAKVSEKKLLK